MELQRHKKPGLDDDPSEEILLSSGSENDLLEDGHRSSSGSSNNRQLSLREPNDISIIPEDGRPTSTNCGPSILRQYQDLVTLLISIILFNLLFCYYS